MLTIVGSPAGDGREYTSRVQTRHGYATVRVPFNSFRAVEPGAPPLDPADAARLSVRYEPRMRVAATIIGQEDSAPQCAALEPTGMLDATMDIRPGHPVCERMLLHFAMR